MKLYKKVLRKSLSFLLTFNLFIQSFTPFLVTPVYADDSTPSSEISQPTTSSADIVKNVTDENINPPEINDTLVTVLTPDTTSVAIDEISTPSADASISTQSAATPAVEVSLTVESTPASVIAPESASDGSDSETIQNNESSSPPQDNNQSNNSSPSVIANFEESRTEAIQTPQNTTTESLTIASNLEQALPPKPTLTTDKPDYFPTDTVYITGTNFLVNTSYTLNIFSSDNPIFIYKPEVISDENGYIYFSFTLDGHYRPNYSVDALDASGIVIASYSFTDSSEICLADAEGVNDEPGQKDLTKMCFDTNVSSSINTKWQWDDISWTGNNTGDACNLFDTDNDGKINYAICVTIGDNPAVIQSTTRYSCGDDAVDKCTSPVNSFTPSASTTCLVSTVTSDPFSSGANYPSDTQGSCSIDPTDVGGTASKLIDVCSYPSQQPNSNPSDCIAAISGQSGKLELKKILSPSTDSGKFNLLVNGVAYVTNIGNGGTTSERELTPATYSISETAGDSTTISDYSSSIECRGDNGTGSIVASTIGTGPLNVAVGNNDDIVCTFTNTLNQATLIINKTAVGGNDTFNYTVSGPTSSTPSITTSAGTGTTGSITVTPGTYTVSESSLTGWAQTSTDCPSSFTVATGETKTCTFTNTKYGSISGFKYEDGTTNPLSGWLINLYLENTLYATQSSTVLGYSFNNLLPGNYFLSEGLISGWTQISSPSAIILTAGENEVDQNFVNFQNISISGQKFNDLDGDGVKDSGEPGLANWKINLNGADAATTDSNGNYTISNLGPGSYTITEDQQTGWTQTTANPAVITAVSGQNVTGIDFGNFNYGYISGHKFNDLDGDGAWDSGEPPIQGWKIYLDRPTGDDLLRTTNSSGYYIFSDLPAGTYTVYEEVQTGWIQTAPASSTYVVTVTSNGSYPDRDFGNFKKAKIVVHKNVLGTNGTTDVTDTSSFTANINGSDAKPVSEILDAVYEDLTPGTYTIAESATPSGYSPVSITNNGIVSVTSGGEHHVYITNKQNSASLTVIKHVINDNGGTATASAFTMNVTGTNVSDSSFSGDENGTTITLDAGTYSVDEATASGYTKSIGEDCSGTVAFGDTKTCTITNDDIAPKLTLIKNVITDNGGNEAPDDFNLTIGGDAVLSGVTQTLSANTPYALNETPLSSYSFISIGGDDKCPTSLGGSITLDPGDDITCTITNDDIAPSITITKEVDGGSATADNFDLYIGGNHVNSGETVTVDANKPYSFDEDGPSGYTFLSITGDDKCPDALRETVTLDEDEDLSCTITNTRDTGTIIVNKIIDIDGDLETTKDQSPGENWQFDVDGEEGDTTDASADYTNTLGVATFSNLKTGEYAIIETTQSGYDLVSATCGTENGSFDGTDSMDGVAVSKNGTTTCTFYNTPNGTIHGYKWNDENADGFYDLESEDKLPDWTINLYKWNGEDYDSSPIDTMVTDSGETHFGWYWFEHLFPGKYKVCEELKEGWTQTYPASVCHEMTLPDENSNGFEEELNSVGGPVYKFGNQELPPEINISKYNNATTDMTPGSAVTFRILLNILNSKVNGLTVKDLLPKGFTYRSGSYQVKINSLLVPITEPEYHSPGTWNIGSVNAGDEVELLYTADIASDQSPGSYLDVAWAMGTSISESQVLAKANADSKFGDNFVSTTVNVIKDQTRSDDYGVEQKEEVVGQVLGASTDLPATGANELWLAAALLSLYFGIKLVRSSKTK